MPSQKLPGLHSGVLSTVAPGDPTSRSMGVYSKGHSFNTAAASQAGLPSAAPNKPVPAFRNARGGVKPHPKTGGLGGGSNGDYGAPRYIGADDT